MIGINTFGVNKDIAEGLNYSVHYSEVLKKSKKKITFSRSAKLKNIDDPDDEEKVVLSGFKKAYTTGVAVFAGGRNISQAEIAGEVRQRIIRIVSDFI